MATARPDLLKVLLGGNGIAVAASENDGSSVQKRDSLQDTTSNSSNGGHDVVNDENDAPFKPENPAHSPRRSNFSLAALSSPEKLANNDNLASPPVSLTDLYRNLSKESIPKSERISFEQPKFGNDAGRQLIAMLNQGRGTVPAVKLEDAASDHQHLDAKTADLSSLSDTNGVPELKQEDLPRNLNSETAPRIISPIQVEQPRPLCEKPSPFTFFSPFDALDALAARQRAASSPATKLHKNSGTISPVAMMTPEIPRRQASHSQLKNKASLPSSSTLPLSREGTSVEIKFANTQDQPAEAIQNGRTDNGALPALSEVFPDDAKMPNMPSYDKPESGIIPLPQEATSLKNVKAEAKENAQEDRLYGDWTYVPRGNGLKLPLPDDQDPQALDIDLSSQNKDVQTISISDRQAIARFTSSNSYSRGRQIAVNGLISYATRAGRIRVIDPHTGVRIIRKIHTGLADDIVISDLIQIRNVKDQTQDIRRLASCTSGKLVVWQMPAAFNTDDVQHEFILDLNTPKANFTHLAFSPNNPHLLACATCEQRVVLVDLEKCLGTLSNHAAEVALSTQSSLDFPANITAMAFSFDGSALVTISERNELSFTSVPSGDLIGSTLLNPTTQHTACDVALLQSSATGRVPVGLALARAEGNCIEIYDLNNLIKPSSVVRLAAHDEVNFGHLNYLSEKALLAISSSSRGSIFFLALDMLEHKSQDVESGTTLSDSEALSEIFKAPLTPSSESARLSITHVVELPTSHNVIQTVFSRLDTKENMFYLHSEGFEQVTLDQSLFEAVLQNQKIGQGLFDPKKEEGSEVKGEEEHEVENGQVSSAERVLAKSEPADAIQPSNSYTDVDTCGVNNLVIDEEEEVGLEQQVSNMREADASPAPPLAHSPVSLTPSFLPTASLQASQNPASMLMDYRALLSDQSESFKAMLLMQQETEKAQHHEVVASVSDTITNSIQNMVENSLTQQVSSTIKKEIDDQLLPELLKAFNDLTRAVDSAAQSQAFAVKQTTMQQVRGSVIESLSLHLPQHFDNISRQLPQIIAPAVDACVQRAFLPHFEHLENLVRATVADQVHTINNIRQTMMTEQMKREETSVRLEAEIGALRSGMTERLASQTRQAQAQTDILQTEIREMKALLHELLNHPAQPSSSRAGSHQASGLYSESEAVDEPPVPEMLRPSTPANKYEDMFLRSLKDDTAPLVRLIDEAPLHRMTAVFPLQGQPAISAPNILALLLYIAREFALGSSELGTLGKKRLDWLFAAVQATVTAKTDSRYASYLPRIYTDTLHSLNARRKILTNVEDIEAVGVVLQTVDLMSME